ncbi:DnaD and phage-associated domain-containing protein [Dehalogenimonas formicexedens]|uniref:DnaD and phage-associated domain-containing protein n=1 Tax=Dehalogenimonas formicexedens TaxID=1839801 RepID=A0A1P8F6I8_9CHLR|nr:DnaD domain protein [Dehalogenimonas formicexedens]APV44045.1 DnaD and phage-associated domain-containing protein [Dehalogenimonas formicexedens]
MKFTGFPEKFEFAAVPKPFLAYVLPAIDDLEELKATLVFFQLLYQKKGFPVWVTAAEVADSGSGFDEASAERSLNKAVARSVLMRLAVTVGGRATALYLLNDDKNREAARKIIGGDIKIKDLAPSPASELPPVPELPDIFSLYEQNVGLLTPMIADELKEALKLYPEAWIKDAIKEAVSLNKRSWRYISKILDNWNAGGRDDGTYQRYPKEDRDKYIKGKYGKFVQR